MSEQVSRPAPGQTLLGRYRVSERIGDGSFSEVFRVVDTVVGFEYALKFPTNGLSAFVEREMRFWLRLDHHPNVVSAVDVTLGDHPHLLLEYVGGGTLRKRMTGRPWPVDDALPVLRDIAMGMAHANSRGEVAHLDLKPENVLLEQNGAAKVSDFGLVRQVTRTKRGYPSVPPTTGTKGYQAPEVLLGTGPVDSRCDIYSFGLIALELLTGKQMFPGGTQSPEYYLSAQKEPFWYDFASVTHPLLESVPGDNIRNFIAGCLMPQVERRTPFFGHVLRGLRALGVPPPPADLTPDLRARIKADAARRALSEARILIRMDETDAAIQAINRSVLFSGADTLTRVEALKLGATVLREEGRIAEADHLNALNALPPDTKGLALATIPIQPHWEIESLTGQRRTIEPFHAWPPRPGLSSESASRTHQVQKYLEEGKFASAMRFIRGFLAEDANFALTLAAIVLHRTRTDDETAPEPLDDFDHNDPWFDCLRVECSRCYTRGWPTPLAAGGSITEIHGSISPTGFSQCAKCRLTLCYRCHDSWERPNSFFTLDRCSNCGGQVTFPAQATGRTRPWNHDLRAAPVEAVVVRRAGAIQFSQSWIQDLAIHVSPDLLLTGQGVYGGPAGAREGTELLAYAGRNIQALIDSGVLPTDAHERTEAVWGTDGDGVPYAMLKVLRSPKSADKTLGILFNIDRLDSALYGSAAYKILFKYLDPMRLAGCRFLDGDTHRTLASLAREYCIAIEAPSAGTIAYIRSTIRECPERSLLLYEARFLEWAAVANEPLVYAGTMDSTGTLVVPENSVPLNARGTRWKIMASN